MTAWRIGFFVTVDVEAVHELDAVMVANAAAGWPGDWEPPHKPVEATGHLNGRTVTAGIVRSQALMIKARDSDG